MGGLLRAEWIKMWGRPADFYLIAAVLGLGLFSPVMLTILALSSPAQYYRQAQFYLAFPINLDVGVTAISFLDTTIASFLAASTIGSEYADNTWKLIVPRRARRGGIILSKLALSLLTAQAVALLALALWIVGGALCSAYVLGLPTVGPGGEKLATVAAVTLVISSLRMFLFGAVAALAAIVFRSSLVGIAVGFLAPGLIDLMTFPGIAAFLPNAHLWNLRAQLLSGETAGLVLRNVYQLNTSVAVSLLVVVLYVGASIGVSTYIFERQEIAT